LDCHSQDEINQVQLKQLDNENQNQECWPAKELCLILPTRSSIFENSHSNPEIPVTFDITLENSLHHYRHP
ncbi:MAG: hypothetical protein V2I33_22000, partial [Kangiellaceae bacterium]|nr:hypothetical protein [Kangiellaceae bacterium]